MTTAEIYDVHLSHLPQDQKADLVMRLLQDLEGDLASANLPPVGDQWRQAWTKEIESRLKRLDRGESQLLDWEDAIAEIRDDSSERAVE
jgi:hypothetical protein